MGGISYNNFTVENCSIDGSRGRCYSRCRRTCDPNPSDEGLVAVPVPPAAFAEDLDLDACVVVEH